MSGTEDNAGLLPLPCGSPAIELLNAERSTAATVRGRCRWSREENLELMKCYYLARAAGKGYQKRLKDLWDSRNPDKKFRSSNNLSCQARAILRSKLLSEFELCEAQLCILVSVDADCDRNNDTTLSVGSSTDLLKEGNSPLLHDNVAVIPPLIHDDAAMTPSLIHDDAEITPPLIHDDAAITPPLIHDDAEITPSLIHDDAGIIPSSLMHDDLTDHDDAHNTDGSLQATVQENTAHDFDSLLSCVQGAACGENISSELQNVFDQLFACLSKIVLMFDVLYQKLLKVNQ